MADLVCRWRNGTPKTVVELVNSLPHTIMPNKDFRECMASKWNGDFFRTPYQLACQLGLYYESEDGVYYPRFDHDIDLEEARDYLFRWIPKYYVPNPYVRKDGFNNISCPTFFLKALYDYTVIHPNCEYKEAFTAVFKEPAKNNDDIIGNYINNFSRVLSYSKDGHLNITGINPKEVFEKMDRSDRKAFFENFGNQTEKTDALQANAIYRKYISAIRTKPFLLLAGISGTGKSRIVRQLARACDTLDADPWNVQKPYNYEMISVKPNWHDSTELLGYVSRVSGKPKYIVTDFLRFVAKAWLFADGEQQVPFFLCLDEMNLAPVEQYFAEYLSVMETRKVHDGVIVSDPLFDIAKLERGNGIDVPQQLVNDMFDGLSLPDDDENVGNHHAIEQIDRLKDKFKKDGITLPPNLIVIGTVNMDETTYSFSRKVLDRAMTIEMNEVILTSGLHREETIMDPIAASQILPDAVEGYDFYEGNSDICDQVIEYLGRINDILDGTPFKIAYRTRNDCMLYVVNNVALCQEDDEWTREKIILRAIDEVTSMKILSRIEGDKKKVGTVLTQLKSEIEKELAPLIQKEDGDLNAEASVSLSKIKEMNRRLDNSFYCSFWS